MIAVWMIYSIAISALVVGAGLAVERLCISLRWPTRWVWAGTVVLSLVVAANNWRVLQFGAESDAGSWATVIGAAPSSSIVVAGDRGPAGETILPRRTASRIRVGVERMVAIARQSLTFDPSRFDSLDNPLLAAWIATSTAALLYLAAAIVGMRRLTRGMPAGVIDGHPVLMSRDIGPALIGVVRARIVLPPWVAELRTPERRLVLAHESEHAAAGDPLLLVAGVALVAIQAWNLALWFAVARLRFSIESDCDARVLRRLGDPRSYGRLLVRVHTQSAPMFAARLAFTGTTSHLEWRIQRLLGAGRPRKLASMVLVASCLAGVTASACFAPTPIRALRQAAAPAAVHVSALPRQAAAPDTNSPSIQTTPRTTVHAESTPFVAPPDSSRSSALETGSRFSSAQSSPEQVALELGCGRQSEGFFGPTFAALRKVAHERYGALFDQVQTTARVIAFAVDGTTCAIKRDTVLEIPISGSYSANVLYARAFPELPERSPEIGLGDARDHEVPAIRGNPPLMILYALTNMPRERASCTGAAISANATCSITGEVVIRVMDSTRVLIATENHLFMFTSAERFASIASETIQRGHIEYDDGAIVVYGLSGSAPVAFSVQNGKTPRIVEPAARWYSSGLGLSHYAPTPVPLDAISRLKVAPCPDSDTPVGSCFEVDGKSIRFPR